MSDKTVVFQGIQGSYSEEALNLYFGDEVKSKNVLSFEDVFQDLNKGSSNYGVLPVENSSTGSIVDVFDLLAKNNCYIVGEELLKVDHCLMGIKGSTPGEIKEIYSHPQGFFQCREFLKNYPNCKHTPYYNTAISAKFVQESEDRTIAAIGSKRAAKLYGLEILKENINSNEFNSTRFIIIAKFLEFTDESNKTSIVFSLPHESGTLYKALTYFYENELNLLKIESRPMEDKPWEYMFFIDFAGNLKDANVKNALSKLEHYSTSFKTLGNYISAGERKL